MGGRFAPHDLLCCGMSYGPVSSCQVCGCSDLQSVLFLGYLPPVNLLRSTDQPLDEEPWFPAEILSCPECLLVQLGYTADPNILFPPEYPYTSGTTRILRDNFKQLAEESSALLPLQTGATVMDIGSNDGTLLLPFKELGYNVLGIEPSLTAKLAEEKGVDTLMRFFNAEAADEALEKKGKAQLVTAANVFAHMDDINELVEQILRLLTDDGVFVSESHYLLGLLETVQYDTIYHEHLRYYSLHSVKFLLEKHGLEVFHVVRIPTHGGSIRVYAGRKGQRPVDPSVAALLAEEEKAGLTTDAWMKPFADKVRDSKLKLYEHLSEILEKGGTVYGIGAPSRGSTLLSYTGIDVGMMPCIMEIAGSKKIGKYMPGRKIPVLDEEALYRDQPSHVLFLSWHIADELMKALKKRGYNGDFIVPLPTPRVVPSSQVSI